MHTCLTKMKFSAWWKQAYRCVLCLKNRPVVHTLCVSVQVHMQFKCDVDWEQQTIYSPQKNVFSADSQFLFCCVALHHFLWKHYATWQWIQKCKQALSHKICLEKYWLHTVIEQMLNRTELQQPVSSCLSFVWVLAASLKIDGPLCPSEARDSQSP